MAHSSHNPQLLLGSSAEGLREDRVVDNRIYTKGYFDQIQGGSMRSAEIVVPLLLALVPVHSIVDVGCGVGTWLSVFRRHGVEEVLGLDGDYVERNLLQFPETCFAPTDLSKPVVLARTFDLAVSLEVAEHLPRQCAPGFVESLVSLAPVILFSAAIPFQGGNHHINEQWPDEWIRLFQRHDYLAVDCIRNRVWENPEVDWWYAQNSFLFVRRDFLERSALLKVEYERTNPGQFRLVHPRQYLHLHGMLREAIARAQSVPTLKKASRSLLLSLGNSIRCRLGWARDARGESKP
jgi:SAM-dependent methyltransferase